ncbi:patatin-like phospholipase family protein [Peribacillus sp. NJ11]|uniref:patatin-like phospholipase family protein n=1 Tax=Peribacillus sp. NJ11 TaxID=3055861 RepID=UPI0025A2702F|nr:patatin-like phospholipase family protein [Peribacillus sp. NJ11]MDM5223553.1 patatin-like phospholipase family protein [Peribacillus sp. NJ11]
MKVDAVFEGGGVRGIGFVGAIEVLEENGYEWERLAGTSAGSIIATLLASGYSGKEIKGFMVDLDYQKLLGKNWLNNIPVLGNLINICLNLGIYSNDYLEQWINDLLAKKGVHTFADLPSGKLKIIASDISCGRMLVIPDDLEKYGLSESEFPLARAVRMSTSIPFFFKPVKLTTKGRFKPQYIVDGGILSNYPVWIFDVKGIPRWPTFGFRLTKPSIQKGPSPIQGPVSMFKAMFRTMMQAHDLRHVEEQDAVRTIFIPTGNISTTEFSLNEKEIKYLYLSGFKKAEEFLDQWNFEEYKVEYRGGNIKPEP